MTRLTLAAALALALVGSSATVAIGKVHEHGRPHCGQHHHHCGHYRRGYWAR